MQKNLIWLNSEVFVKEKLTVGDTLHEPAVTASACFFCHI